ncbi:hypothetical protein [Pseudacidovorax sp. RU35E]|nr:hypothetical protein [Pseudacidovorax sp. RU35E]SIP95400.1 hypothetical protein SAMN05880557_101269 [Pseudacidovorax sp. RU35E]
MKAVRESSALGRRLAAWGLAAAVLAGVFLLYAQPDFLVMLENQIWTCFG